ncbi:MAG TPA: PilZ domain-containing protein [Terriglobales bacterium]|nr:PilZ domain-containing protein [Terriglobales bacterium]
MDQASSSTSHTEYPREHTRHSTYRDLSLVYEGASDRITVHPPDLSPRGMFIHLNRYFPQGAVVKLRFTLARSGHEVHTRAEVRYCLEGVGIGVEFIDISEADQQAIEREVNG